VIFATVGSSQMPFPRLMAALSGLAGEDLVVQHGPASPPARVREAVPFLPFTEIVARMERADAVICHTGVGSVLCALRVGHTPIVVPRLRRYSETVDDHQRELAEALAREGRVIAVLDAGDLADAVASAPPRREGRRAGKRPLHDAVRAALHGVPVTH
jgi:UDP-N-acetylglucosamine transferase subunit ALG13